MIQTTTQISQSNDNNLIFRKEPMRWVSRVKSFFYRRCDTRDMFNPSADNKILALSKLKAFADVKFILVQMVQFLNEREENTVGKGENAGNQHFLLFPQCFSKVFSSGGIRSFYCKVKD